MSTRMGKGVPAMRKRPGQARSRATVDAVVEAAARILSDEGWAGFTTNKVAAAAGVSIGSYYQYFPDKYSLVDAIRGRHLADCLAMLKGTLAAEKPAADFIVELVDGIIALHSQHPGLHRVLLDEAPSSEAYRDPQSAFEKDYLGYFAEAVRRYCPRPKTAPDAARGTLLSDAIDGVVHNAARRGRLGEAEIRGELIALVSFYLLGKAPDTFNPSPHAGRAAAC